MKWSAITRVLAAGTPLYFLLVLLLLFLYPVRTFVQCQGAKCDPIDQNLTRVLVVDDPKTREVVQTDTEEIKTKKAIKEHERVALMYSGRLTFLFFAVVYGSVCVVAFAVGCFVIAKSFAAESKYPINWTIVLAAVTGALGFYLYHHPERYMRIFDPLLGLTISHDLEAAKHILVLANSFGFSVALFLTLASCAVLYSRNTGAYPDALKQIGTQMKYLRLVLYLGTFMLVSGVLLIRSVYQWSLAFLLRDDQAVKIAERFFSDLLSIEGAYFTLVLAVVYLPAAFILQRRADSLSELPELDTEKEKVLKEYGLGFSVMQSLPRILAILGPLLAGPIGELFSRVG
jgi:hypothetical protein